MAVMPPLNLSPGEWLNYSTSQIVKTLNCDWVKVEVASRIGIYAWLIFAVTCWLMAANVLKSRGEKGKSCLRRWRGPEWFDKTAHIALVVYFVAAFWLLTYAGVRGVT